MDRIVLQRPAAERRLLLTALDEAMDAEQALDVRLRERLGVNGVDFAVLRFVDRVHRRGGTVRVGDVAGRFGVSSGSATEIVHRLTRSGLLRRVPHPGDARVRRLVPTDDAGARLEDLVGDVRARLQALVATVTVEEEERLVGLLAAVRDILAEHEVPAEG